MSVFLPLQTLPPQTSRDVAGMGGRDDALLRALVERVDQQDPGAFNNVGVLYHARGLHAEAVDAFLRALAIDPRMRTAARNLEIAAASPGACDARIAALDARMAADPHDRAAAREHARLSRLVGHTEAAIRQLEALIAEDPGDGVALFERGLIEQRAGDLQHAQWWLQRAVDVGGVQSDVRLHLADVLYQQGRSEHALACLDHLLGDQPDHADAHFLRGVVLDDLGQHDAAIAATRRAAELNPSRRLALAALSLESSAAGDSAAVGLETSGMMHVEPEGALARYGRGLALRQQGYFHEARREFEQSLVAGENARMADHALAELDLLDGRFDEARVRYTTLLAEQEQPRLWNEHGVALHQGGSVHAATDSYRHALRLNPRYALAHNNLGVALHDLGDVASARESFTRAAELDPACISAKLNLARWFAEQRELQAALALLREMVALHPQDAEAWHVMGTVLLALRQDNEARDAVMTAIACRPSHAEARFVLAHILEQSGDSDGAARETQQALRYSAVRRAPRMAVGIDLQQECPTAVGAHDWLAVQGGAPLRGVTLPANALLALLPEAAADAALPILVDPDDVATACSNTADAFATRGVHGEALERYRRARDVIEAAVPDDIRLTDLPATSQLVWQRAALGEARCLCLLGRGGEALPMLRRAGSVWPQHTELLALFASAAAAAATATTIPDARLADTARTAMMRLLRQDVKSAALLHFVGDAALMLHDESLALGFYRRALAHDPARPSARVAIARMLRERGDLLAARLELVAALTAAPEWEEAVRELARVHRDATRYRDARWVLVDLLTRTPTDIESLELLIEVLVGENRPDDARVVVDRVLRHDAMNTGARWFDGVLLAQQSRTREALQRWAPLAQSADLDPFVQKARLAVGHAMYGSGAPGDPARVA